MYRNVLKRAIDIVLSLIGILVLWPVLVVTAIIVKLDSPGPVLFCQERAGKGRKPFTIYKFRTMRTDTPKDVPTHMLKGSQSFITKSGAVLRRTSLDELPQLFNILKGDMAVVGPRPALMNQVDLLEARDLYGANDVRPGLTGLAQISGRDELPIEVKARLDGKYVQNIRFVEDVRLIFGTIKSVAHADGIVEGAQEDKK